MGTELFKLREKRWHHDWQIQCGGTLIFNLTAGFYTKCILQIYESPFKWVYINQYYSIKCFKKKWKIIFLKKHTPFSCRSGSSGSFLKVHGWNRKNKQTVDFITLPPSNKMKQNFKNIICSFTLTMLPWWQSIEILDQKK